jgi:hypothetical protein
MPHHCEKKRARSLPPFKRVTGFDIHAEVRAHGDKLSLTATALAELAAVLPSSAEAHTFLRKAIENMNHEFLVAGSRFWKDGLEQGKWLAERDLHEALSARQNRTKELKDAVELLYAENARLRSTVLHLNGRFQEMEMFNDNMPLIDMTEIINALTDEAANIPIDPEGTENELPRFA